MNLKLALLICNLYCIFAFNPLMSLNINRRDAIYLATSSFLNPSISNSPITIIGANGGTGRECTRLLAEQKKYVKAISRQTVKLQDEALNKYIESVEFDIKDKGITTHIKGSSAVLFLANAKRKLRYVKSDIDEFQNYEDIDVFAMNEIVESCIKNKIPKLVYVSASCKSCLADESQLFDKISGIECENCLSKQLGENIIRKAYATPEAEGLDYTIIRIGFLINGENRGVSEIELNQDYTKSGFISRTDLANVCIASVYEKKTLHTTFEAYYRDTTQPYDVKESLNKCTALGKSIEECFFGSEYKDKKPQNLEELRKKSIKGSLFTTGCEYSGNTWKELFKNLQSDNADIDF